jgi:hypothetical protein
MSDERKAGTGNSCKCGDVFALAFDGIRRVAWGTFTAPASIHEEAHKGVGQEPRDPHPVSVRGDRAVDEEDGRTFTKAVEADARSVGRTH